MVLFYTILSFVMADYFAISVIERRKLWDQEKGRWFEMIQITSKFQCMHVQIHLQRKKSKF